MEVSETRISRRAVLRGAAGGAALLATGGLPAWARPVRRPGHLRHPDSRPFPHFPAGTASMPKIDHIVVLIMENHSFDNVLGRLPYEAHGRQGLDGLTFRHGRSLNFNRGTDGKRHFASRAGSPCQPNGVPRQDWNASHESFDRGRNDGFVRASGPVAMWYWDRHALPFTYSLAHRFPIGQRYFCSVLAQTYPNRRFFFTGTASGTIATDSTTFSIPAANGTIFDRLDEHQIDWAIYFQNLPSLAIVPGALSGRSGRLRSFADFATDVAAGRLPQFTFIDPNYTTTSEENPQDVDVGERFLAGLVHALTHAPTWRHTVLFITYDEHGGYYDHVPPPRALEPDSIAPLLGPGNVPGGYNRYGFRVPLIVVSPWARAGYASSVVQDHTSITAFIEHKWNLPAMTYRDANAQPMTDYFDFGRAAFARPPRLAAAPQLAPGLARCSAEGLTPPLPNSASGASASEGTEVGRLLTTHFRR